RGKSSSTTSRAIMGQEIALQGEVSLEVHSPRRADIRLLRDGRVVARKSGKSLRWTTSQKGVYRVEAYRSFLLRKRGWVFTNPIYVR
ncbi:MAG: histidinol phosphatase, partial [Anaerolineae bacterium]|nr:histidinol phosphatase [Anaerolineae bacterium]